MKKFIFGILILTTNLLANDLNEALKAYNASDYKKAAKLSKKACDNGNAWSCNNLGFLYDNGQGVKKDYKKASNLYQKACNGGYRGACFNLGLYMLTERA